MALLYVETNYLMGVATGRYPEVTDLLDSLALKALLCLPTCCVIEAFAALEGEQARRNALTTQVDQHIGQLQSGVESPLVRNLVGQLEQVKLDNQRLVNEFQNDLVVALAALLPHVTLIESTAGTIAHSIASPFCDQLTDNLILHTIAAHADANPLQQKAFFTANAADFSGGDARETLNDAGVTKLLKSYPSLKQWLASADVK